MNQDLMRVRSYMSEERFCHTLGVRKCALWLGGMLLPNDLADLEAAAMLHDIVKERPQHELYQAIQNEKLELPEEELAVKALLHAYAAPSYIRMYFPEYATKPILDAVFYHTVGRANMNVMEKIVFLSDFVEEGRSYTACKQVRLELEADLAAGIDPLIAVDRANLSVLDFTIRFLLDRGAYISVRSLEARNSLISSLSHS